MADDLQQTAKESKGIRNRLKKAIGLGSRNTPQSRSNSPSAVVAPPVVTEPPSVLLPPPVTEPPAVPVPPAAPVIIDPEEAAKLRAKYTRFRILVIGRANAGKTTLLKRVCNTTEEPSIYDKDKNLLEPTAKRGIHDVRRSFTFKSNPGFIFHDSPGFEAGGEEELKAVMTFIQERSKSKKVDDQIHVIWFCFDPDVSRPLLPLEVKFFNEDRAWNVPVVAIFMKFDDLITQVLDRKKDNKENTKNALDTLEKKFKQPLSGYKFCPRAYVHVEAIHRDGGNHQEQVGKLIKQTAASIDNLALKMLFVTVQQNNLEVCIRCAVNRYIFALTNTMERLIYKAASWFGHCYWMNHDYGKEEGFVVLGVLVFAFCGFGFGFEGGFEGFFRRFFQGRGVGGGGRAFQRFGEFRFQRRRRAFTDGVHNVVSAHFNTPSLYAFIAILICLEHSFWLTQQGSSPTLAFTEALDTYLKDKRVLVDQRLENYLTLNGSDDWFTMKHSPSNDECIEFEKIVLDNLLPHPKHSI